MVELERSTICLALASVNLFSALAATLLFRLLKYRSRFLLGCRGNDKLVAFFHPYCDGGGGGERVLWMLVACLLHQRLPLRIAVYSGDTSRTKQQILHGVRDRFLIDLTSDEMMEKISIVNIYSRSLLEAKHFPVATMLCQSLASIIVGIECLLRLTPDIYFDTTGAAFTYPLASLLARSTVLAYVHYPIISSDMLNKIREQRPSYNNDERIASSVVVSNIKLAYYLLFAKAYSFVGLFATGVMVNSSWTEAHIASLWGRRPQQQEQERGDEGGDSSSSSSRSSSSGAVGGKMAHNKALIKLFPPCNTSVLQQIPISSAVGKREAAILSIGQFRPEKDHFLQLKAFRLLLDKLLSQHNSRPLPLPKLVIIGSTRNKQDEDLAAAVGSYAKELDLYEHVELVVNAPFSTLQEWLAKASVGLHTMWNEHFGISVVEMMAAGLIVVAHNTAGPALDIVTRFQNGQTGFLASTPEEYSLALGEALEEGARSNEMRIRARASVSRFSDEAFAARAVAEMKAILSRA